MSGRGSRRQPSTPRTQAAAEPQASQGPAAGQAIDEHAQQAEQQSTKERDRGCCGQLRAAFCAVFWPKPAA